MARINEHYAKLPASYLFPEIGRRVSAFAAKNPGALAGQGAGTVRALSRHRARHARHPVQTTNLLVMRAAEAAAYAAGYAQGRRR